MVLRRDTREELRNWYWRNSIGKLSDKSVSCTSVGSTEKIFRRRTEKPVLIRLDTVNEIAEKFDIVRHAACQA